jgi:hypothetical protein
MAAVQRGIELRFRGERAAALAHFTRLWDEVAAGDQPLHRCAVAHQLADLQDDAEDELAWDLLALDAAAALDDAGIRRPYEWLEPAQLFPSLHLNVAEACRKLGRLDRARHHLGLAEEAARLATDPTVRQALLAMLDGLRGRLAAGTTGPAGGPGQEPPSSRASSG